jgi:hypothetical protein
MRMLRRLASEWLFPACLCGLAVPGYGWLIYPPLGTLAAIANAAFVLALLMTWLIRRLLTLLS